MTKYNACDRLMFFYTDEKGEQRTQIGDIVILKVPPFTYKNKEQITDKYLVYDDDDEKKINRLISKEHIENEELYKKIDVGGKKLVNQKKHRKSKKQRKSKKR